MNSVVIVLTPNGRRQNIKVQPNTTLLKVLEEVCEKHKFDPNEYDLKHHKRIVDLTTPYRFAGLPNNCLLEMVEAQKKRQDAEVELIIQLSDGSRVNDQFKPNTKLSEIIEQLCPNENTGSDLFAIYMRTEVPAYKLDEVTLKDLGLLSGRAIIRLVHRDPNAAKIQANVALNLQPKSVEAALENESSKRENKMQQDAAESHSSIVNVIKKERAAQEKPNASHSSEPSTSSVFPKTEEDAVVTKDSKPMAETAPTVEDVEQMEVEEEDTGEIHILGERNAVLFTLDAANSTKTANLPDSFFDLNVQDIKLLIKDLRSQAEGSIDQPLLTAKLREMEEEQNQLSKLNRYKTVIIRIQFPNRYVLQGTFTPYETIEKVMDFVRSYLSNGDIEFYLYTTPPKSILVKELRLFEAGCVPAAVLHFGTDQKEINYLKEDILCKISSPKASLMQASCDRGLKEIRKTTFSDVSGPESAKVKEQCKLNSDSFRTSSSVVKSENNIPKWFKPPGK